MGDSPTGIAVGDFNEDGLQDLAVASSPSAVVILTATAPAVFAQPGTTIDLVDAIQVQAADIDGDGHVDLAVGRQINTKDVTILWGAGDGAFPQQTSVGTPSSARQLLIIDFNKDGKLDVVASASGQGSLTILKNQGNRMFLLASTPAVSGASGDVFAVGDFNADQVLDIATGGGGMGGASAFTFVLLGDGQGGFGSARATPSVPCPGPYLSNCGVTGLAVGRFDADAFDDIVMSVGNPVKIGIAPMLSSGQGSFTPPEIIPVGDYPYYPKVADLNADGRSDVVVPNYMSDSVSILLGTGGGVFDAQPEISLRPLGRQPSVVAVADLNGDGELDIASANILTGNVSLILSSP